MTAIRTAVIKDDVVENIILVGDGYQVPADEIHVASETAQKGDVFENGQFVAPVAPQRPLNELKPLYEQYVAGLIQKKVEEQPWSFTSIDTSDKFRTLPEHPSYTPTEADLARQQCAKALHLWVHLVWNTVDAMYAAVAGGGDVPTFEQVKNALPAFIIEEAEA